MSGRCPRAFNERIMAINGVMPLPALTNRTFGGGGAGSAKAPLGAASRTIVPGLTPLTRGGDRKTPGGAFTVIVMHFSFPNGTEGREYERQCQRPSAPKPDPPYR